MKKSIAIPGVLLLVINILAGLILSKYSWFNVILSSCVIILFTLLINFLYASNLRTAFRISLISLFLVNGIASFVLSVLSPDSFQDNWYIITILILIALQSIFWVICNTISNKVKE
jgi:hypothetical protein